MARIRSVHPGLFTDEAFMCATPLARVFMIGLWSEAFDDGVFEWKPLVLKARLLPADNVDASALLDELCGLNVIRRVERNGRVYGLIRNFCKFQRPKKPTSSGVLMPEDESFVGRAETGSEPVRNRFGTGTEFPPQMEDGEEGGRVREEKIICINNNTSATSPRAQREPEARPLAFPPDGGVTYSGPWAGIVRSNAKGHDPDVIASRFREWCRSRDPPIPFDHPKIADKFRAFATTHAQTNRLRA